MNSSVYSAISGPKVYSKAWRHIYLYPCSKNLGQANPLSPVVNRWFKVYAHTHTHTEKNKIVTPWRIIRVMYIHTRWIIDILIKLSIFSHLVTYQLSYSGMQENRILFCDIWWNFLRYEFKSWTRLIAFHIALMPLGKVWIQLFSLQLWINSRADWVLPP